jgi:hypothetical protein
MSSETTRHNLSEWDPTIVTIHEPVEGREASYRPWEPTPALPNKVNDHQLNVSEQHIDILENHIPPFVSPMLARYVETMYLSREANRTALNISSYRNHLHNVDITRHETLEEAVDRTECGTAQPEELLLTMEARGMASIELAKLTHLYGYRLQYIDAMRDDVRHAINFYEGEVIESPVDSFDVIALDQSVSGQTHPELAFAMKRERTVGRVDGSDIIERSSFIVRIDRDSAFDAVLAEKLKRFYVTEELHQTDESGREKWRDTFLAVGGKPLADEIQRLLASNDLESIIPLSTTIYARNREIEKKLTERKELKKRMGQAVTKKVAPSLVEAQAQLRAGQEIEGIVISDHHTSK